MGDPINYTPLVSTGGDYTSDGIVDSHRPIPRHYARLGPENGHPGLGSAQGGAARHRAIGDCLVHGRPATANTQSAIASFARKPTVLELDVLVHINGDSPTHYDLIESGATASFDTDLGHLSSGDTIYVTIGPTTMDVNDFFTLDFSVDLLLAPGDYNGDGIVNLADYTVWRDTLGQSGPGLPADGTGPPAFPMAWSITLDYDLWRSNFGQSLGEIGQAALAVPETNGLCQLLFLGSMLFCICSADATRLRRTATRS